jgi:hypothetical protein
MKGLPRFCLHVFNYFVSISVIRPLDSQNLAIWSGQFKDQTPLPYSCSGRSDLSMSRSYSSTRPIEIEGKGSRIGNLVVLALRSSDGPYQTWSLMFPVARRRSSDRRGSAVALWTASAMVGTTGVRNTVESLRQPQEITQTGVRVGQRIADS